MASDINSKSTTFSGDISIGGDSRNQFGHVYSNTTIYKQGCEDIDDATGKDLLEAAAKGHTNRIRYFIKDYRGSVAFADGHGLTALHFACYHGFHDAAEILIQAGANVDLVSPIYGTPLCLAVLGKRYTIVSLLLNERADPDASGGVLGSALHVAAYLGDHSLASRLIYSGARVDLGRRIDLGQLGQATRLRSLTTSFGEGPEWVCTEVEPLIIAAHDCHTDVVSLLLKKHARPDARTRIRNETPSYGCFDLSSHVWDETALHHAAVGMESAVKVLLNHKADPNAQDSRGWTPLMRAVNGDYPRIVRMLVEAGARIDILNEDGKVAADWLREYTDSGRDPEIVEMLHLEERPARAESDRDTSSDWVVLQKYDH